MASLKIYIPFLFHFNFFGFSLQRKYLVTYSPLSPHNIGICKITTELFGSPLFHLILTEDLIQVWKSRSAKTFLEEENFAAVQEVILQKVTFFRNHSSLTNSQPDKHTKLFLLLLQWNPWHENLLNSHKL